MPAHWWLKLNMNGWRVANGPADPVTRWPGTGRYIDQEDIIFILYCNFMVFALIAEFLHDCSGSIIYLSRGDGAECGCQMNGTR